MFPWRGARFHQRILAPPEDKTSSASTEGKAKAADAWMYGPSLLIPDAPPLSCPQCPPCCRPERSQCWGWLVFATPSPSFWRAQTCPEEVIQLICLRDLSVVQKKYNKILKNEWKIQWYLDLYVFFPLPRSYVKLTKIDFLGPIFGRVKFGDSST